MNSTEYHLEVSQPGSLATRLLAEASGLSLSQIKLAMTRGAVWLSDDKGTHRLRRAKKALAEGSSLHFYYNPAVLDAPIPAPELIADEGEYSVWVKPRGMLSQGSKWGDHASIARWVEMHDPKQRPGFIVHRLDRAASGLILVGHSKRATAMLAAMFARNAVSKLYRAIVSGHFEAPGNRLLLDDPIDDTPARTQVALIEYDAAQNLSLLEVEIETGRKHQIRKHLSAAGFPIIGDRLYGGGDSSDLQLCAISLGLRCPLSDDQKTFQLPASQQVQLATAQPHV